MRGIIIAKRAAIKRHLNSLWADPYWHYLGGPGEPNLVNSWAHYDASRYGWDNVAYRKDVFGFVQLKGLIKGGTPGTTAFTLPVGWRLYNNSGNTPRYLVRNSRNPSNNIGRTDVLTDGQVKIMVPSDTTWTSISETYFWAGVPDDETHLKHLNAMGRIDLSLQDTDWHEVGSSGEPAYQNAWVKYSTGYNNAGFLRDAIGRVHLKGMIKNGTSAIVFNLPEGYRPYSYTYFPFFESTYANHNVLIRGTAGTLSGNVQTTITTPPWGTLDSCCFPTLWDTP